MQTHDEPDLLNAPVKRAQAKPANSVGVSRAVSDPTKASAGSLLELQRLAGNATVSRMLSPTGEEQAEERSPVLDVVGAGGGTPLDDGLRSEMEGRLGGDFGDVKVHTDSKASDSAKSVQANAYTVGNDVVFGAGQFSPSSETGKETIAHELTHVMQQRSGPVAGTDAGGGIKLSHPSDEFETAADQTAKMAMSAPSPAAAGGGGATAQGSFVQRAGAQAPATDQDELPEDAATAQGSFVQRAGAQAPATDQDELPEDAATAQGSFVQRAGKPTPEEEALPDEQVGVQGSFVQRQTEDEMLDDDKKKG